MNSSNIFTTTSLLMLTAASVLAAPAVSADTDVNESAKMDPRGRVRIENVAGEVVVEGWDRAEVELTGSYEDNIERVDIEASGKDVRIEVVHKRNTERSKKDKKRKGWGWHGGQDQDANLRLRIPRRARLAVETVSADVKVSEHFGEQDLGSVSGEIETHLGEADADIESVSGNLEIRGRDKDIELRADAVSGDILVRNFRGDIEAESVSGDIELRNSRIRHGSFDCVSGDIELDDVVVASNGRIDIETVSGDVSLGLSGNVDAEFRIETHSGDIDEFFGNKPQRTSRYGPGEDLRFSVGNGSADISVSTMSGDVENRISGR